MKRSEALKEIVYFLKKNELINKSHCDEEYAAILILDFIENSNLNMHHYENFVDGWDLEDESQ